MNVYDILQCACLQLKGIHTSWVMDSAGMKQPTQKIITAHILKTKYDVRNTANFV